MLTRRTLLAIPLAAPAFAQAWPDRPIRMVVPFPAGAATDLRARQFAEPLSELLGQPVVVDNRGGANGVLGAEAVARARPDGHTLLYTANTTHASNPALLRRLPYDPAADFTPVFLVSEGPMFLVIHPGIPARSVAELVAYARGRPGGLNSGYGSASARVGAAMFAHLAGIEATHVPYRANPAGIADVIAGRLDYMVLDSTTALPQLREGRVRALGVTSGERLTITPDVPALAEQFPQMIITTWTGMFGPAGLPAPVLARLVAAMEEITARPAMVERLSGDGSIMRRWGPERFAPFLLRDIERWRDAVRKAGIEPE
jgi:tripartite-type tricarboxylate transporter receptor subunit TctC